MRSLPRALMSRASYPLLDDGSFACLQHQEPSSVMVMGAFDYIVHAKFVPLITRICDLFKLYPVRFYLHIVLDLF